MIPLKQNPSAIQTSDAENFFQYVSYCRPEWKVILEAQGVKKIEELTTEWKNPQS